MYLILTKYLGRCLVVTGMLSLMGTGLSLADQITGPSSSREPYLNSDHSNTHIHSIISTGDYVGDYRMVGSPDGLGALDNEDLTFSVFMHHELSSSVGVERAHGGKGAFISEWKITKPGHPDGNFKVLEGNDLIQHVYMWDAESSAYKKSEGVVFNRFCSADLPEQGAFWFYSWYNNWKLLKPLHRFGQVGSRDRIFLGGEEKDGVWDGSYGRAFATVVTGDYKGEIYELPSLGNMAFENVVANPFPQSKTVVAALDDSTSVTIDTLSEVYFYIGRKQNHGHPVERAGLTNGRLNAVSVRGLAVEDAKNGLGDGAGSQARFRLVSVGDVFDDDGTELFEKTKAYNKKGITKFLRLEDGQWDPTNPDVFYFITTGAHYDSDGDGRRDTSGPGRLWKLTFKDIRSPLVGGFIELVLDGTEGMKSPDNMTVDKKGRVIIQEDRTGNSSLARIWKYNPKDDSLTEIAYHNSKFFDESGSSFLTTSEESSGVIDVSSILGPGWLLVDVQAHLSLDGKDDSHSRAKFGYSLDEGIELVEDGQLLAIFSGKDKSVEVFEK